MSYYLYADTLLLMHLVLELSFASFLMPLMLILLVQVKTCPSIRKKIILMAPLQKSIQWHFPVFQIIKFSSTQLIAHSKII